MPFIEIEAVSPKLTYVWNKFQENLRSVKAVIKNLGDYLGQDKKIEIVALSRFIKV